jgi:hypothetical protein
MGQENMMFRIKNNHWRVADLARVTRGTPFD